jgi:hypothetical protein
VERLAQHLGFGRRPAALQRTAAKPVMNMTRIEGSITPGLLRQFDPVHLGHDDVGQQEVERLAFQQGHGLGAAAHGLTL